MRRIIVAIVTLGLAALPGWAQDDPAGTPGTVPVAPQQDLRLEKEQGSFGLNPQIFLVQGNQFAGKLNNTSPDLEYDAFYYFTATGAATPQVYYAPVQLPAGGVITSIQCFVADGSATNDVTVQFARYYHDVVTNIPGSANLVTVTSTGSPGYQQPSSAIAPHTVRYVEGNRHYIYNLRATIAADTSLRECRIAWHRSISPAPATATFPNDVPTSHVFFQAIEALAAAGVTSGCAAGSYCPDTPVTRGQMAAFLSRALGLHFPN